MGLGELIITVVVGFIVYACFYRWVLYRNTRGPKPWPFLGAALELSANHYRLHDWLTTYSKRFTTFKLSTFNYVFHILTDPASVEYILKTNFENYPKGEFQHILCKELLGNGIFNIDGELWKIQRKTASYEFASRVLRDYSTNVFRAGSLKLSGILARAVQSKQPVDMQNLFMRMTLDSICEVGFGTEIGSLHESLPKIPFAESFDAASEITAARFVDPLWKLRRLLGVGSEAALIKHKKVLDEFTYNVIKDRVAELGATTSPVANQEARSDLLSRFILLAKDEITHGSTEALRDTLLNFTIAGRDTSAVSLSWFFYLVSCNPQVEEKILVELLAFESQVENISELSVNAATHDTLEAGVYRFANAVTYDALSKMQYLHAAITEAARLYPAVPSDTKTCLKDDILPDGTKVNGGEFVTYSAYCMGRLERVWGIDASEFRPERWLKDGVFHPESPFKFVTFHAGPRTCLGKDSAYLQMKMTAALLLRFFKFQVVPGHKVHYRVTLVLAMKDGLRMTVHNRST